MAKRSARKPVERCGTCKHHVRNTEERGRYTVWGECLESCGEVDRKTTDRCYFKPSRWTERVK